jgi:glycosyltransferase involved in cell wall biosynthesis
MSGTKRVLVVQYVFPPLGGAGVQRVLKFVKYLVALGWEVKVLTTASGSYPVRDPSLIADVPHEVESIHANEWPMRSLRAAVMNPLHRLRVPGLLQYIGWPDEMVGWLPFAAREGLRVADRFRPDVIFSSSPPMSAHLVARVVSGSRGIPWVADFRDPWAQDKSRDDVSTFLSAASARMERGVVERARYVTVADDPIQVAGLPQDDDRRVVIYNGVDETDLLDKEETVTPTGDVFSLTHVGSLYEQRDAARCLTRWRA